MNDPEYVQIEPDNTSLHALLNNLKHEIVKEIKENNSLRSSAITTPCRSREPSKERKRLSHMEETQIRQHMHKGFQPQPYTTPIQEKIQKFAKNKLLFDALPKLDSNNRTHFKKYLDDLHLEFTMWNHPMELYIPIAIQRTYPDIKSNLLRKYQDGTILTKQNLTDEMAKLCLQGENYEIIKNNYISANRMTENQTDFANLYQTIVNRQVEHLLSLDNTLRHDDMRRERIRLALEMFKASIHTDVLAHCQALGKTNNIDELLMACNNYAQSTTTRKQNLMNSTKKVFSATIIKDDKDKRIEQLEKQLKLLEITKEFERESTRK